MEISLAEFLWQFALAMAGIVFAITSIQAWDSTIRHNHRARLFMAIILTLVTAMIWYACYLCMVKYGVL